MKVLYITGSLPPIKDGVSEWSELLIKDLAVNNDIYIFRTPNESIIDNVHNIQITTFSLSNLKEHINQKFDFIHIEYPCVGYGTYNLFINFLPLLIKIFTRNRKISLMLHEYANYSIKGRLRCAVMALFSDYIFTSDSVNMHHLNKLTNKTVKRLSIKSQIPVINKKSYCDDNNITLGYWGFIREDKGLELILDAFAELSVINPNIRLHILAELNPDISYHKLIKDKIESIECKDRIRVFGYLNADELSIEISKLDLCLLPYKDGLTERRGTFMAPMANGVPVLTTRPKVGIDGLVDGNNVIYTEYEHTYIKSRVNDLILSPSILSDIGNNASRWYDDGNNVSNAEVIVNTLKYAKIK